jgi:hypothetical protein
MAGVRAPGRQAGDLKFSGGDGSGQFDRGHDRAVSVALEFYRIMGAGVNPPPDGSLPVPILTDDYAVLADLGIPVLLGQGEAEVPCAVSIGGIILPGSGRADHV